MKFLKKVLVEEARHEIDWILQSREVEWDKSWTNYVINFNSKKRWPWAKQVEPPTLEEYKKNFAKYCYRMFDWSPESHLYRYENDLRIFIIHCKNDQDPEFIYLNSADIKYYSLNKILTRLGCESGLK